MGSDLEYIFSLAYLENGIVLAGSGLSTGEGDIYRCVLENQYLISDNHSATSSEREGVLYNSNTEFETITEYSNGTTAKLYVGGTLQSVTEKTAPPKATTQNTIYIGAFDGIAINSYLDVEQIVILSKEATIEEQLCVSEYRKYAPNLNVSELTEVSTGVYNFTVENTGETDYENVQAVVDISGLGLTGNVAFTIIEVSNNAPDIIEFDVPYITEEDSYDLTVKVSDDTALKSVKVSVNDTTYAMQELYSNTYWKTIPLSPGQNTVKLSVMDITGQETTQTKTILSTNLTSDVLQWFTHNYSKESTSNNYKVANAIADEFYEVLSVIEQLNVFKDIDIAEGYALDRIGNEIGQERGEAVDSAYRVMLKLKMSRYLSSGTYDDVKTILANAFNANYSDVEITPNPEDETASVEIKITPLVLGTAGFSAGQALQLMQSVVAAGVRVAALLEGTFEFGSYEGEIDATKGFGDETGTTGGTLSGYITDDTELPIY
jgi:hypothetical protein